MLSIKSSITQLEIIDLSPEPCASSVGGCLSALTHRTGTIMSVSLSARSHGSGTASVFSCLCLSDFTPVCFTGSDISAVPFLFPTSQSFQPSK